ncbi:serine hydrolase [Roseateles sp. SL47]|uniref:serine hydrolase n=1 Tax=Roseateles sp. SL47 TaxID=2995138 RepID=UPI0022711E6D|nr:serine hydrolase [Roseateles sp. SL47]WAC71064.1 serine hydrolase [Roseateles sp. SL47]
MTLFAHGSPAETPTPSASASQVVLAAADVAASPSANVYPPALPGLGSRSPSQPVGMPTQAPAASPLDTSIPPAMESPATLPPPTVVAEARNAGDASTARASATLANNPAFNPVDDPAFDRLPINARHMVVVDDAGQVLAAKEPDAVVPIASLTKLMTAMVVLDAHQNPQEELRIDDEDVDHLKHSASRIAVGARITRADALEMALIASENRAASVLARHYPGGRRAFESAMQAKIRALGLTHTLLNDPTGLSPANQSTAAEVARIAMAASHYPDIERITSVKASRVAVNGRPRELHNTNHLVGGKGWDIRLSKTGFTNEAGRCLVMRLKQGARFLTVVLLDTDGSTQRLRDAALIRRTLAGEPPVAERAVRKHHKVKLS